MPCLLCPRTPLHPVSLEEPHALLTLLTPLSPQGIERLKRKQQPRERRGTWKAVTETFGGSFSPNWLNPLSGPCQPAPRDEGWVRQLASSDHMESTTEEHSEAQVEEQSEESKNEDSAEATDD